MAATLKQAYLERLRKIMDNVRDDVSSGSASSYEEYKHKIGILDGIATAEREFLDLTERLSRE